MDVWDVVPLVEIENPNREERASPHLRIEIERRIKMMIPGLWNFEIGPVDSMEFELKIEKNDPPLQVPKCQHRPHPAKLKQAQIEEECFAPFSKNRILPNIESSGFAPEMGGEALSF